MLEKSKIKIFWHFALSLKNVDFGCLKKIVATPLILIKNKRWLLLRKYLPALGTLRGITSSEGE